MGDPNNPHDALFKWTFSQVDRAAAEFRAILPKEVLTLVDLSTLAVCPNEFVDESLAHSYSDLLFRVQVAGEPGLIYILFEHQSSADEIMPLRLVAYIVRVLELEVRGRRERREPVLPLPVVIPAVLHHSADGWTRALRFEELFEPALLAQPALAALVPRFEFVLDDLSHLSDAALQQRALDQVTAVALWALRDARNPERIVGSVLAWLKAIGDINRAAHGPEALKAVFRYIMAVTEDTAAEQVLRTITAELPDIEENMTLAERWIAEGKAKGRLEGKRTVLQELLQLKFGQLSPEVLARLSAATDEELKAWTGRVLSAASVAEVFEN